MLVPGRVGLQELPVHILDLRTTRRCPQFPGSGLRLGAEAAGGDVQSSLAPDRARPEGANVLPC